MAFGSFSIFFSLALVFVIITCPTSHSIPFILLHGLNDQCSNEGVRDFTEYLTATSGAEGHCLEIGNGEMDSWFMPLEDQIQIICDKVKTMEQLRKGYNIVAMSQGNLVGRGVVEFCEGGPPVKNFISIAGPHAGVASIPQCGSAFFCLVVDEMIKSVVYTDAVQNLLAPATYLKLPNFENDTILIPKETSWFGFYPDGNFDVVLPPQQTKLYMEDWIGLRSLAESGRVKFIKVEGEHLRMSTSDIRRYVVPYLQHQPLKVLWWRPQKTQQRTSNLLQSN
ncbi:palmitoyl-protein thioesterase 1-like isoform X2 [Momordica charantia]|uniref:Palmitoyl-protein thioesterase 1-like isoform X2 n=1 Tax=Momordica charantia TaxID=3673 RepID=A0A6J1E2J1_MOMCH|nr:palmitoyl-protein thioesterase 1-like isoform X2 [Momordica charantia]